MSALVLILLAALPQRLVVTFEQGAGGCALEARVPHAIGRFLPGLELARNGEGWHLLVRSRPGEIELVLEDERGEETLRRTVPSGPDACAATADGIGLIVERHLRDLGYVAPVEAVQPAQTATAAAVSRTATVAAPVEAKPVETGPVEEPLRLRGRVGLFGMLEAPSAADAGFRAGGGLELSLDVALFRVGVSGFGMAPGRRDLRRDGASIGAYEVFSAGGLLHAGACWRPDRWSLCGLLGGGLEWVGGRVVSSQVFMQSSDVVLQELALIGLEVELALSPGWVFVRLFGLFRPNPGTFRVGDIEGATEPYTDPRWALFVSAGGGLQIF